MLAPTTLPLSSLASACWACGGTCWLSPGRPSTLTSCCPVLAWAGRHARAACSTLPGAGLLGRVGAAMLGAGWRCGGGQERLSTLGIFYVEF